MAAPGTKFTQQRVQFGPFELDLSTGELRKHGLRLHLQTKPFQVLRALLENPGTVLARDELHKQLWSEDTFVDFERGLNTAVNRLRIALGDSAETPRYIETLARVGYRFAAPVTRLAQPAPLPASPAVSSSIPPPAAKRRLPAGLIAAAAAFFALCTLGAFTLIRTPEQVHTRQITFQRGQTGPARFAADNSIVYAAQWESGPRALYITGTLSPESRMLGFTGLNLASISKMGELALFKPAGTGNIRGQELFLAPMNGGGPVRFDDNITGADWSADGRTLAVVRAVDGANQLEAPPRTVLYRTPGWIGDVRWEPNGQRIAFIEHPLRHDDGGAVKLFDRNSVRALTPEWASARGLSWNPPEHEIWFTAASEGSHHSLWAVSPRGGLRQVAQYPGSFVLRDIAPNGTLLLNRETRRLEMGGLLAGDERERALSWLDWSRVQSISADAKLVLFDESGEAVGLHPVAYLYDRDSNRTEKIGEGGAMGISPDGRSVLLLDSENRKRLRLAPVGGGAAVPVPETSLTYQWARFLPNNTEALALAEDPAVALGLYRIHLRKSVEPLRIVSSMMIRNLAVSPDGDRVAVLTPAGQVLLYSTSASNQSVDPQLPPGLAPLKWSADGGSLFVQDLREPSGAPSSVYRFDLTTKALRPWKTIAPCDPIGVNSVTGIVIAADEKHYVYSYRRILSELFTVQGLR